MTTAPQPLPGQPNPIPDTFQQWSRSGCTYVIATGRHCGTEDTDTLSWLGRRCAQHPPVFEPEHAVDLHLDGWTDTALAYVRWSTP